MEFGEQQNILQSIVDAFNEKDVPRMLSFFAEDIIFIRPEGTLNGKEEIKQDKIWNLSSYLKLKLEKSFIAGDKAVLEFFSEGIPGSGNRKQRMPGIVVFEFNSGKVQQVHEYYDRHLIEQLLSNKRPEQMVANPVSDRVGKNIK